MFLDSHAEVPKCLIAIPGRRKRPFFSGKGLLLVSGYPVNEYIGASKYAKDLVTVLTLSRVGFEYEQSEITWLHLVDMIDGEIHVAPACEDQPQGFLRMYVSATFCFPGR